MTRMMGDSTAPADIPDTLPMVAGYVDGVYAWPAAGWALHADKVQVRISVIAANFTGDVLDVESGDATPQQAPIWAARRRQAGCIAPCVYCSLSAWSTVRAAFQSAKVPEPLYWIADYDNVAQIPAGAIAKQYANAPLTGGHYDQSIVAGYWPGVDKRRDMILEVTATDGSFPGMWVLIGSLYCPLEDGNDLSSLNASGAPVYQWKIDGAQHKALLARTKQSTVTPAP